MALNASLPCGSWPLEEIEIFEVQATSFYEAASDEEINPRDAFALFKQIPEPIRQFMEYIDMDSVEDADITETHCAEIKANIFEAIHSACLAWNWNDEKAECKE